MLLLKSSAEVGVVNHMEAYSGNDKGLGDGRWSFNPLNAELNLICYLLALLAHHFLHVSRIRVKSLTLRLLMSYIYDISNLRVNHLRYGT